jgi:Domain of unknown function (DU1801)
MVQSAAPTVAAYLKSLPAERRAVMLQVRSVIRRHLPAGYEEKMNWGMIAYQVPRKRYPDTYNGQPLLFAAIAAQKNNYSLYLMCAYQDKAIERALLDAFRELGRKPDMGKSCIRFRSVAELPLDAIGSIIGAIEVEDFIRQHERGRSGRR